MVMVVRSDGGGVIQPTMRKQRKIDTEKKKVSKVLWH